jgi:hypothetical protein
MEIWSLIGIVLVLFVFYKFLVRLGNTIPVLELMLLIAGLQWIVGPFIEYSVPGLHYRYKMYVEELQYMEFIVPAYGFFVLGVLVPISKYSKYSIPISYFSEKSKFGLLLLFIGISSDLLAGYAPGALAFFVYLLSNFKFAGAIILFFSKERKLRIVFYLTILYLFYNSLQNALFHDFVLWGVFFYMFWAIKYKPKLSNILAIILLGILFLITLQTVKAAYRSQVWSGYSGNKVELFLSLIVESIFTNGLFEEVNEDQIGTNVRLNQGWIISSVMDNIPENQEYLGGETIADAIVSSIFPRFLIPDKEVAGGQKNFMRFTGLNLEAGTSMGISIIGESYGNFGLYFGVLFMFIWGLFLASIWSRLYSFILKNIVYICFIPLIFLQVIKAETELVVVLNHLIKSLIVVILFIFIYKQYLNRKFII